MTKYNGIINPKALGMVEKIKREKEEKAKQQEIINAQIRFAFQYKICPICANILKGKNNNIFSILKRKVTLKCNQCGKVFKRTEIEDETYY